MTDPFIKKLINSRLIQVKDYIINNYVKLGLNEKVAMLLIHIYNINEAGEDFLSLNKLKEKMSITLKECADLVLQLVHEKLLAFDIVLDDKGRRKEKFTLEPLYSRIVKDFMLENDNIIKKNHENEIGEMVQLLESEFGRPLSSFEIQMIASWINESQYDFSLIQLAVKEALLANAYNLKYIDRILLNWQQKNIVSVDQAKEYTKTFKRYEAPKPKTKHEEEEVYVSWMK